MLCEKFHKIHRDYLFRSLWNISDGHFICFHLSLVKLHASSIFFRTQLDGCVWSMKIIFHTDKIQTIKASLQKLLMEKTIKMNKFNLGIMKKQCLRLYCDRTSTLILHACLSTDQTGRVRKIMRQKNLAWWSYCKMPANINILCEKKFSQKK